MLSFSFRVTSSYMDSFILFDKKKKRNINIPHVLYDVIKIT